MASLQTIPKLASTPLGFRLPRRRISIVHHDLTDLTGVKVKGGEREESRFFRRVMSIGNCNLLSILRFFSIYILNKILLINKIFSFILFYNVTEYNIFGWYRSSDYYRDYGFFTLECDREFGKREEKWERIFIPCYCVGENFRTNVEGKLENVVAKWRRKDQFFTKTTFRRMKKSVEEK